MEYIKVQHNLQHISFTFHHLLLLRLNFHNLFEAVSGLKKENLISYIIINLK